MQSGEVTILTRREQTALRITLCAQRLSVEHGYDAFTLDDLATAAGVSRRTLFNYFPSKLDAVIGTQPGLPAAACDVFVAGGPHGDLLDDLGELVVELLLVWGQFSREEWSTMRACFETNPRVFQACFERFETLAQTTTVLVVQREGWPGSDVRAGVATSLIKAVFGSAMDDFVEHDDDRSLDAVFRQHLQITRLLLHPAAAGNPTAA